ncbi:phosphotransferase enzyme family protein [Candidatus Izemoplasma sp. B36]|uniref:phosphotransferase enzyme family protein n=1 Tax=Candidatus Izemoplasma sp. B36 TaxID=3242468 RepID=UPI0035587FCD
MEKHISDSMNDEIIKKAAELFDIEISQINYHGGFENFIYMFTRNNLEYVLRFVHSDHKIYEYVLGEIEFIDYLDKNGACVSTIVKSKYNNVVERIMINDKDYFTVSVFTRGLGQMVKEDVEDPNFWSNLGEQVGLLHKLTKKFKPKHKRPIWYDDTLYQIADKILIKDELPILNILKETIDYVKNLEENINNYGLIHTDLHLGNMVIDKNKNLTFFDFDDAAYKHFISDIAIVIFYRLAFYDLSIEERNHKSVWILNNFFKGYSTNNKLPKKELLKLNDFLKLRELTLYTVLLANGQEMANSEWVSKFIKKYRKRIIHKTPFIDTEYLLANLDYND